MEKRMPRFERTTQEQLRYYEQFCKTHPEILQGKRKCKNLKILEELWKELSRVLNSMRGPTRSVAEWQKSLTHWRNQIRSRARREKHSSWETSYRQKLENFEELDVVFASEDGDVQPKIEFIEETTSSYNDCYVTQESVKPEFSNHNLKQNQNYESPSKNLLVYDQISNASDLSSISSTPPEDDTPASILRSFTQYLKNKDKKDEEIFQQQQVAIESLKSVTEQLLLQQRQTQFVLKQLNGTIGNLTTVLSKVVKRLDRSK